MEVVTNIINQIGITNLIIAAVVIVAIIVLFFIIKSIRLKNYRKKFTELENKLNSLKSYPVQYNLKLVEGIAKNIPEIKEKYNEFVEEYNHLNEIKDTKIKALMNQIDDNIFNKRTRGLKDLLKDLENDINEHETAINKLLTNIEEVTEIENEQRLIIINLKGKYRETLDSYETIRYKVDDFVPEVNHRFDMIDEKFIQTEDRMNDQDFIETQRLCEEIRDELIFLNECFKTLPECISIVRKFIPKCLNEIAEQVEDMKNRGYAVEKLDVSKRYNDLILKLDEATKKIKALELNDVPSITEYITDGVHSLKVDFEEEEKSFKLYNEKKNLCYEYIQSLQDSYELAYASYPELERKYVLEPYDITINDDYAGFQTILERLNVITDTINTHDFSYTIMLKNLTDLVSDSQVYDKNLTKYNNLASSLELQEKRALNELENINIVLLEIKAEIKNHHLPMIDSHYKDYINESYKKSDEISSYTKERPYDLIKLTALVDETRDLIYKLYDNVHNLVVTVEMIEEAILYGNQYRSSFVEVNSELTRAELKFKNGEYTEALKIAYDIIEKIKPGTYELLVKKNEEKS